MTESKGKRRAPRVFELDDETVAKPEAKKQPKTPPKRVSKRKPKAAPEEAVLRVLPDEAAQRLDQLPATEEAVLEDLTPPPLTKQKTFGWGKLFWSALLGLISLAMGIWIDQLIRELFARQDWLGWIAIGLAVVLVIAALVVVLREVFAIRRMARIESIRDSAAKASEFDDMGEAKSTIEALLDLYSGRPDTAKGRAALESHETEIIDGRNLISLAERDLMVPLDEKARSLVMGSAKRVSVVTAVSPRAIVDIGFVLVENIRLMRKIAHLYGGQPGTFGFWRLARNIISHLAVTGTIAVGEGLIQQMVGQGIAARLSARLGEGVVNGLLTARIGIAAMDVCRPLPFSNKLRPSVKDFLGELTKFSSNDEKPAQHG